MWAVKMGELWREAVENGHTGVLSQSWHDNYTSQVPSVAGENHCAFNLPHLASKVN